MHLLGIINIVRNEYRLLSGPLWRQKGPVNSLCYVDFWVEIHSSQSADLNPHTGSEHETPIETGMEFQSIPLRSRLESIVIINM